MEPAQPILQVGEIPVSSPAPCADTILQVGEKGHLSLLLLLLLHLR